MNSRDSIILTLHVSLLARGQGLRPLSKAHQQKLAISIVRKNQKNIKNGKFWDGGIKPKEKLNLITLCQDLPFSYILDY